MKQETNTASQEPCDTSVVQLMVKEMKRYLPILEAVEATPDLWQSVTRRTGIATLNGYRNAIKIAEEIRTPGK